MMVSRCQWRYGQHVAVVWNVNVHIGAAPIPALAACSSCGRYASYTSTTSCTASSASSMVLASQPWRSYQWTYAGDTVATCVTDPPGQQTNGDAISTMTYLRRQTLGEPVTTRTTHPPTTHSTPCQLDAGQPTPTPTRAPTHAPTHAPSSCVPCELSPKTALPPRWSCAPRTDAGSHLAQTTHVRCEARNSVYTQPATIPAYLSLQAAPVDT